MATIAQPVSGQAPQLAFKVDRTTKTKPEIYALLQQIARVLTFRIPALAKDGAIGIKANRLQIAGEKADLIQVTLGPICGGCASKISQRATVKSIADYLVDLPQVQNEELKFAVYDQDRKPLAHFDSSMRKVVYQTIPNVVSAPAMQAGIPGRSEPRTPVVYSENKFKPA